MGTQRRVGAHWMGCSMKEREKEFEVKGGKGRFRVEE